MRPPRRAFRHLYWPLATAAAFGAGLLTASIARQLRPARKAVNQTMRPPYGVEDEQFQRSLVSLLPPPLLPGNRIFPAMLEAIRSARHSITMETFIYWSGSIGRTFADALCQRARAGVCCHVLLDWLGSNRLDEKTLHEMAEAGVQVVRYHRGWRHFTRLNHRTHRKILVVDGTVGFIGGVGIADQWLGDAQDECHWRDNHYRIEGPVVAQLQSAFTDNWLKAMHVALHSRDYFPPLQQAGEQLSQVFQSSPDEGSESLQLLYLFAMGAARRSIRIASAYFVPDDLTIQTMVEARERGVEVEVIVPGPHIDVDIVRSASRDRWGKLLEAGVHIHEFMPSMYHCKAMIIDELWSSVGSANFDSRSFRLNDEANLNVYDRAFALEQVAWYERDRQRSRSITLSDWKDRGIEQRAADQGAGIVSGQL